VRLSANPEETFMPEDLYDGTAVRIITVPWDQPKLAFPWHVTVPADWPVVCQRRITFSIGSLI
jgi:hypothetical protein